MISSGTVIGGRYQVADRIGEGGMQEVYRAADQLTGRIVALKTPLPGQGAKRFANSAIIAARVNHHHVAKTYDYLAVGNTQYLVEEFVNGRNLEQILPDGVFIDPHSGARMFLELAKGIAASHAAGVVHRDLKPSNLLAEADDTFGIVKITDFGIATLTEEVFSEAAQSGDLTRSTSGTVRGALPYMAPEMMFRKPGDHPGAEADVWSLGALMFRLMTGEYPFGVGFEAPVNVRNGTRAPWPGFMTSKAQFAPLARELQTIIDFCLNYSAADRPTASDLVAVCSKLCFATSPRSRGMVDSREGNTGRIRSDDGQLVFFHRDSFYGSGRLAPSARVSFSKFPGSPLARAHPIVRSPI